jgi:hypothetical protein
MNVQPVFYLVAGAGRLDDRQPVAARFVSGLSDDFNDVTGMQLVTKRNHATIYFCAGADVTDFGMDGISEVDGR